MCVCDFVRETESNWSTTFLVPNGISVIEMEVNPLSIILVKSDSKGDRLLFRYPYRVESNETSHQNKRRNPYSIPAQEDILQSPPPQTSNIHQGRS